MKNVLNDASCYSTCKVDASVGQSFEGSVSHLNGKDLCELFNHLQAEGISLLDSMIHNHFTSKLLKGLSALGLKGALKFGIFLRKEIINERDGRASAESLYRHSTDLVVGGSLIFDVV